MLKPSQTDQADAYLKLFQANFWFNVIIIVQDALAADGFYEQMKSKTQADAKWNVAFKIMPETISDVSLFSIFTSLLGNEPKIVVIHADLVLVMRIFKYIAVGNFTSVNHAWFITDSSFTRDHNYLGVFPSGTFSVIHNYVSNTDDVVLDGTNFLIKSVIQSSDRAYIPRSCWSNDTRSSTTPISDYMYR
ncbi:hypothetical protein DPMN_083368 [Dreissena polymorpha]|uniref:Receptor ligand binding region domain-containing protein n=1 Tax=Dreissena polymorpha TaxID=45954 RepID=A0A9D3YCG6_DREPO|nr:hypothetical protein DPMN_083368 [Dreissena polymorpha]